MFVVSAPKSGEHEMEVVADVDGDDFGGRSAGTWLRER